MTFNGKLKPIHEPPGRAPATYDVAGTCPRILWIDLNSPRNPTIICTSVELPVCPSTSTDVRIAIEFREVEIDP